MIKGSGAHVILDSVEIKLLLMFSCNKMLQNQRNYNLKTKEKNNVYSKFHKTTVK